VYYINKKENKKTIPFTISKKKQKQKPILKDTPNQGGEIYILKATKHS